MLFRELYDRDLPIRKWDTPKSYRQTAPHKWSELVNDDIQIATFGAGCFWGTEKFFAKDFVKSYPKGSILATSVGFMHPDTKVKSSPSYDTICDNQTGHIEVVHMLYDQSKVSYDDLCKFFFTFHDPTTRNQQE